MAAPIQGDAFPRIQRQENAAHGLPLGGDLNAAAINSMPPPTHLDIAGEALLPPSEVLTARIEANVMEVSQRANANSRLGALCEFMKKLGADIREKLGTLFESMKEFGASIRLGITSCTLLYGAFMGILALPYIITAACTSNIRGMVPEIKFKEYYIFLFSEIRLIPAVLGAAVTHLCLKLCAKLTASLSVIAFIPAVLGAAVTHLCLKLWVKSTASLMDNLSGEELLKQGVNFAKETNIFLWVLTLTDDTILKTLFPNWDLEKKTFPNRESSLERRVRLIHEEGDTAVSHRIRRASTTQINPESDDELASEVRPRSESVE